jgi:hypothetical protein
MSTETKNTNPKDAIGSTKLPLDLVPDTAVGEMALAFLEGALKYGKFNWRVEGVRASIYIAAARRHLAKFVNGEDEDQATLVPHLASVMACCAIILDAKVSGKLVDDRPPVAPVQGHFDGILKGKVAWLQELFKDHSPHQHVITDAIEEKFGSILDGNNCSSCGKVLNGENRSHNRHEFCKQCCGQDYGINPDDLRQGEES